LVGVLSLIPRRNRKSWTRLRRSLRGLIFLVVVKIVVFRDYVTLGVFFLLFIIVVIISLGIDIPLGSHSHLGSAIFTSLLRFCSVLLKGSSLELLDTGGTADSDQE
jgi:hypothetical protein